MKESTCLRLIIAGVTLIAIGLLLPGRSPDLLRAIPIVGGSVFALLGSFSLLRLHGARRDHGRGKTGE